MKEQDKQLLRASQDICAYREESATLREESTALREENTALRSEVAHLRASLEGLRAELGAAQAEGTASGPVTSPLASKEARAAAEEPAVTADFAESRRTAWLTCLDFIL